LRQLALDMSSFFPTLGNAGHRTFDGTYTLTGMVLFGAGWLLPALAQAQPSPPRL
jgi:hypothetical protein